MAASRIEFAFAISTAGIKTVLASSQMAASVEHKRVRLAELYRTQDIVEGDDGSILRRLEYSVQELGMGRWHGRKKV